MHSATPFLHHCGHQASAMLYRALADLVLVVHLAFIVFVVGGALLVLRWPRLLWVHLPAAVWGVLIELQGWVCPLTPLENRLRMAGGLGGYDLYMSLRMEEGWSEPVNLGPAVNSEDHEMGPCLSADGRWLYFSSNRPGGMGGYDIYRAERLTGMFFAE